MTKTVIPRWLEIQMEVDYKFFLLHQMLAEAKKRSGIDVLIDQTTGFEESQIKEATKIHKEIKDLIEEYNQITNHEQNS